MNPEFQSKSVVLSIGPVATAPGSDTYCLHPLKVSGSCFQDLTHDLTHDPASMPLLRAMISGYDARRDLTLLR
jgi:hypothetical protein